MKHFLRSCLATLASVFYFANLSAQTACPIDSTITYDENDNPVYKTEYSYDAQGRINGTTTYRWENNVLIGDSKTFTVFDGSGRHITDVNYLWDATRNRWIGADSTVTVYTGSNITEKTIYAWDTATDNWIGQTRYTYTYFNNNANKKTLELEEHWSTTADNWEGYLQTTRTYNTAGNLTEEKANQSYNTATAQWYGGTRKVYNYNGNTTTKLLDEAYTWDAGHNGGAWKGSAKTTWTFNASNKQTNKTTYTWNTTTWNWQYSKKDDTSYDSANRTLETASYNYSSGNWVGTGSRYTYNYNSAGKQTAKYTWTWSSGWQYSKKDSTRYDSANRTIETASYNYSAGNWVGTGNRYTYLYNSSGRETEKITYTWSNGNWVNSVRDVNIYDGSTTRKTETASYNWNGTSWVGKGVRTTYVYNSAGKEIDKITFHWGEGDWEYTARTESEYSGNNLLSVTASTWSNGAWLYTTKTTTTYSGSTKTSDDTYTWDADLTSWIHSAQTEYYSWGKITNTLTAGIWTRTAGDSTYTTVIGGETTKVSLKWNTTRNDWGTKNDTKNVTTILPDSKTICDYRMNDAGDWNNYSKTEFQYDDQGRTILNAVYTGSGQNWIPKQKTEQSFDENGHQISYAQYIVVNNEWFGTSKTAHTYDNNLLTSDIGYNWSNNQWVESYIVSYTYNEQGQRIEYLRQNYNAYDDTWTNFQKYEYGYNASGDQSILRFYGWQNDQWQYVSRSEKTYDDDAEGKLREELTASYTNGAVQSFSRVTYFYHNDPHYIYQTEEDDICDEALPYTWHGKQLNEAGQLIDTIPGTNVFDTIITFTLTVNYRTYNSEEATIKDSQLPYVWNNMELTEGGEHPYTTTNVAGCDSTVTLTLTILPTTYGTEEATIYSNELPYVWHNKTLYAAGDVKDTLVNAAQGDSIITFTLTVINLVKAHKNVPMQIVCPGTVINGRSSSKTITAYTQWIDSVRIEYSPTNLVDSFYHYSAMPYSLSAPELDESLLNPVCRDYLNLDALKDQVLGYINADALYAPLIEPVTSALEWQIRYDSEEWRGWLNLPVSDTNSILSLRVIIHTDCGDAITEPIEAQIQCQPTALDELYEPFNPDAPAYNLLGQPVSPDYHGVVIQSGHKYIR